MMTPEPDCSRGVLVVGMHRSGTSAVARILNLLGLPLCATSDLMPQLGGNPTGHWESQTLMWFNEQLLSEIGAYWNFVPDTDGPVAPWHALARHAAEARSTFLRLHPTPTWVWKDPRLCVLLPFWRTVLACDPPIVLVLRHPMEISRSLAKRDGVQQWQALLLWERSLRHALLGCAGAPLYVIHYTQLLADPLRTTHGLMSFIQGFGLPLQGNDDAVMSFLNPQLRHAVVQPYDTTALNDGQERLLRALLSINGPYERFDSQQVWK
jgi:hypothetical protein